MKGAASDASNIIVHYALTWRSLAGCIHKPYEQPEGGSAMARGRERYRPFTGARRSEGQKVAMPHMEGCPAVDACMRASCGSMVNQLLDDVQRRYACREPARAPGTNTGECRMCRGSSRVAVHCASRTPRHAFDHT